MAFDLLFVSKLNPKNAFHAAVISLGTGVKLAMLFAFIVVLFAVRSLSVLAVLTGCAALCAAAFGVAGREVRSVFAPFLVMALVATVAQLLYCRTGDVLVEIAGLAIYSDAFVLSGAFLLRFAGALIANVAFMQCVTLRDLMSCLTKLLSPLERIGVNSGMFVMALEAAFVALPLLVEAFDAQRAARRDSGEGEGSRSLGERVRSLGDSFGEFFDRSFESVNAVVIEMLDDPTR